MNGLALCAGAGGLELGLQLAIPGLRTVCYVEREAFAAAVLVARMEEAALEPAPVWDDLATFDGRPWRGVVDLISAGFPCQPFSAAGKQRGTEDERWLWPLVERVVGEVLPGWVFLENVPGLVRHGLGPVLGGLARLGYDAEWDLFSAAAVGAPHRRERFFLLARRVSDAGGGVPAGQPGRGELGGPGPAGPRNVVERLADAGGARLEGELRRSLEGRPGPRARGGPLADAESRAASGGPGDGHGAHGPAAGSHEAGRPELGREGEPRDGGPLLADADRGRREGVGIEKHGHERSYRSEPDRHGDDGRLARPELPLFPPGPDDLEVWARVLDVAPEVEPAFCRVADGVADRLDFRADRLRLAGNGVVPLESAYAFGALAARAGWTEDINPTPGGVT